MKRMMLCTTTAAAMIAAPMAFAGVAATATTDLNLRDGPGAWHEVVGTIAANGTVDVEKCYSDANWCKVTYEGQSGWAYGAYLKAGGMETPVAIIAPEAQEQLQVTTITIEETPDTEARSAAVGAGWGAIAGALVAGPAGAAVGAILATPVAVLADPGPEVTAYVETNPVEPVYLDGELIVGAGVPESVTVYPVPDSEFSYLNVNGVPVIIEPEGRQIVRIVQ